MMSKIHRITTPASVWTWCDLEYGKYYPARASTDSADVTCRKCCKLSGVRNWRHKPEPAERLPAAPGDDARREAFRRSVRETLAAPEDLRLLNGEPRN